MKKPAAWNVLHDEALALLTGQWQRLGDLKERQRASQRDSCVPFTDLCAWGFAEERRTPLFRNGISAGERMEFRRKAG